MVVIMNDSENLVDQRKNLVNNITRSADAVESSKGSKLSKDSKLSKSSISAKSSKPKGFQLKEVSTNPKQRTTRLGKIAAQDSASRCHWCNNEGKIGGCPNCGRTPRSVVSENLMYVDLPIDIIPKHYQGKMWEKPEQTPDMPLKAQQFDNTLEKVCNIFLQGNIPNFSMYIAAPPKSGKNLFAYTCMQTCLLQHFSVAPLMSTSDWRRLHKVSQLNPFYKFYGKYKWDELIAYDVIFLFVDHTDDKYDEIPLLKSILDARAALGLPTFIISDYSLTSLVPRWNLKSYSIIYNPNGDRDYLRYPVVISRV